MQHVLSEIEQIRDRTRWMLIILHLALFVAWLIGGAAALITLDYMFRLPGFFRFALAIGAVAAIGLGAMKSLAPSIRYQPSLVELALRIERAMPTLSGRLASSVEFAATGVDASNPLAARTVRDTEARLAGASLRAFVQPKRMVRDLVIGAGFVAGAAIFIGAQPAIAQTGVLRYVAPFGSAAWPARTAVESLMTDVAPDQVHPRGVVLPLRARNLTDGAPAERVTAVYRVRTEEGWQPWRRDVLTHQPRSNGVHERLVETTGVDAVDVHFETEDAATRTERIEVHPAPGVVTADLTVNPPAYARGHRAPITVDLGPGLDDRARTEQPALVGSDVSLTLTFNTAVVTETSESWLRSTLGITDGALPTVTPDADDPARWRIDWTLEETTALRLSLEDEHGLRNRETIAYVIDAMSDFNPSVTITEPEADIAVLAGATVEIVAEASDDVSVTELAIEQRALRGASGTADASTILARETPGAESASIRHDFDLTPLDLAEGDTVEVVVLASDGFELDGATHEPSRSTVRRLRVISELDFAAQLRHQMAAVRQNAIRIEAGQAELQDDIVRGGVQSGNIRAQAQIAERIAAQRESLDGIESRMTENRLEDPGLDELITQARDLLDYAGRAASEASDAMRARRDAIERGEQAATPADPQRRTATDADRPITDDQQTARDELSDLIELLDRDEDTWVVQRRLGDLLDRQTDLHDRTEQAAQRSIGKTFDELSDAERSELERIADEERDLVADAQRLVEEMRRRADALQDVDPNAASGMRTAADTAEQEEVDQEMEEAAAEVERNQLQSATASQQSAMNTLQRMLDDMEETRKARAEELIRHLASLIESIERLISVQENELIALAQAEERGDFGDRDRAMIRLNQNTSGVAAEARAAGRAARRVARVLDRAADAQGAAITALRAAPVDPETARDAEERSLELLKEARDIAEELQQQAEEEQQNEQREALIAAYRALAEREIVLRDATIELGANDALNRRQRVEARRLGNEQQSIREALNELQHATSEIMDSEVFSFVHELLADWCDDVSDALWDARIDIDVTDRQQMIAESIGRQIDALEESAEPNDQQFAEDEANQGGGGSGQPGGPAPLIPTTAELKRLHGLQEQVYHETRRLEERTDLDGERRANRVQELADVQRKLIELGEIVVEKLMQSGGPGVQPGGEPPAEPSEPETDAPNGRTSRLGMRPSRRTIDADRRMTGETGVIRC